jgi:hypothetical protein
MIPGSTTIGDEGRRLRRILIGLAIVLVVGNLATFVVGRFIQGERVTGPAGSSYVTTALGTAAVAELFASEGLEVTRLRAPYTPDRLDPGDVLVLVEVGFASLTDTESRVIGDFVDQGGRIILAGPDPDGLFAAMGKDLDDLPSWASQGPSSAVSSLDGVDRVPLEGRGRLSGGVGVTSILDGEDGEVVAVDWQEGDGDVIWLADPTPLLNQGLADGDSAGLAMSLAGGRDVVFDEYRHGFGGETFWQLLPENWAGTLLLLGVAVLAGLVAYSRRLGPPEETERHLQPERGAYVESVAAILGRTGPVRESIEPVRLRVRRLLIQRAGLGPDATDDELRVAAGNAGVAPEEIGAALDPLGDPVNAGKALARLSTRR